MILIGSRALKLRAPHLINRQCKDFDFICTTGEFNEWMDKNSHKVNPSKIYPYQNKMIVEGDVNCEFEIIEPGSSNEMLFELVSKDDETIHTSFGMVPNLDILFCIKDSHKYKKFQYDSSIFWKTAVDWHTMKLGGAKIRNEYVDFVKLREKETYNYKHPSLNQNKNNFFSDDNVIYTFDHDDIHKSIALYDKPAYLSYLKDNEEVMCDKNKFNACSQEIKLAGVIEEACVLAIERSLVPYPGVKSPKEAWVFALAKVASSITSGWFRQFAYNNLFEAIEHYPKDYYDRFQRAVEDGKVANFNGSKY